MFLLKQQLPHFLIAYLVVMIFVCLNDFTTKNKFLEDLEHIYSFWNPSNYYSVDTE